MEKLCSFNPIQGSGMGEAKPLSTPLVSLLYFPYKWSYQYGTFFHNSSWLLQVIYINVENLDCTENLVTPNKDYF